MIVRNEAHAIARTLRSVAQFVDRWAILDTGSTDGTQEIIRAELAGVPGELFEEPFIDYATTRNRALELAGAATRFVIYIDADDVLQGGAALREFLDQAEHDAFPDYDAYNVTMRAPAARWESARIVRPGRGWRFVGEVHEVLCHPDQGPPEVCVPKVAIVNEASDDKRREARWIADLDVLARALERDPADGRSAFYRALTLHWLGRYGEAVEAFDRRIALGGWAEEVFYSKLAAARAAAMAGDWGSAFGRYLDAHVFDARRAEPLVDIAAHYARKNEHAMTVLFARRAMDLPMPPSSCLFVEEAAYTWLAADLVGTHAYYLSERELGAAAAKRAIVDGPPDVRLSRNLAFYNHENRGP